MDRAAWLQVVPFSEALMFVFRDFGDRANRQKTRLMWLVEEMGNEAFAAKVAEYMGGAEFMPEVKTEYEEAWKRRDVIGVHDQKQPGLSWVRSFDAACETGFWVKPYSPSFGTHKGEGKLGSRPSLFRYLGRLVIKVALVCSL